MRLDEHCYWMCGIKIISYLTFIARFDMWKCEGWNGG